MGNQSTIPAPLLRLGAAAGVLFLWTVFEKQILEPTGLYAYLPFYRVQGICVWDIAAIAVIFTAFMFSGRAPREQA
jgi:hypothetical protein